MKYKSIITIKVDWECMSSIENAERKVELYVNKGYCHISTSGGMRFNNMIYGLM